MNNRRIFLLTVFFICFCFKSNAQSGIYTGVDLIDNELSSEDINRLQQADIANDEAMAILSEANTKIYTLKGKRDKIEKKEAELKKARSNLKNAKVFKRRKIKKRIKKLEKEIPEMKKKEKIDELEKEATRLLLEAENKFSNQVKFDIFNKYTNKVRSHNPDEEITLRAKALENQAEEKYSDAQARKQQAGNITEQESNLRLAVETEEYAIKDLIEALTLYLTPASKGSENTENPRAGVKVFFRVQVLALSEAPLSGKEKKEFIRKIEEAGRQLEVSRGSEWHRYSVGNFTSLEQAESFKNSINIPDAFVIAYNNREKITIAEARRLLETNQ